MAIEELENKHYQIYREYIDRGCVDYHTKLSIEFAISVLEDLKQIGMI